MKSVCVYMLVCMLMHGMISTNPVHGQAPDSINTYQNIPKDPQTIQAGKTLFGAQCAECHAIGHEIIGPALASVHTRRPLPWLVSFIQNSQAVIQGGDGYANFMYEQYRQTVMPAMEFLSEDEIISILAYIQYESAPPAAKGGVSSQTQSEYFDNDDTESYLPPEALTKRKTGADTDSSFGFMQKAILSVLAVFTLFLLFALGYLFAKKFR